MVDVPGTDVAPFALSDAPDFAAELDEAIITGTIAADVEYARWVPTGIGQAEWAMLKLAALKAREREVTGKAREWAARIDEWFRAESERLAPGISFFDRALRAYAIQRRIEAKEATSTLPSGYISTRTAKQPKVELDDEDAVVAWATEHLSSDVYDEVVKTTPKVLISELRKLVDVHEALVGICVVCHAAIDERSGGAWQHIVDQPDDHEVAPTNGYRVVLRETGEVIPGLHVEPPTTTATVTVGR